MNNDQHSAERGDAERAEAQRVDAERGDTEQSNSVINGEEPTSPESHLEVEAGWHRLHPLSPLLRGGIALLVVGGIAFANLRDRLIELFVSKDVADAMGPGEGDIVEYLFAQKLIIWALLAVLVIVLVIVGIAWMSWRFSTYRITKYAVESRRGVLFRQHRRAPLERIQSVNLQRTLLARVFGLTQVDVQTAGQGGKVELQYLGHRQAKEVREQILLAASVSKGRVSSDAAPTGAAEPVPAAPLAVDFSGQAYEQRSGVFEERLRDMADFDIQPHASERGMLIKVPVPRLLASILLSTEMLVVVGVVIAISLLSFWASPLVLAALVPTGLVFASVMISQFNKGFNFVLSRSDDGVRIGAGLTSTTTETIPFGRVHAVEAIQPLGWRPLGWWKVRITTAGHSAAEAGQNKMQNVVLPVGGVDEVVRVFETLLHGGGDAEAHRAGLREALVGEGDGFLAAGSKAPWVLWFGAKRAGLRIEAPDTTEASLRIRKGWFTRSLVVMPIVRAQSVMLHRPYLHYVLDLAVVQAHTVLGPVKVQMRGIELEQAQAIFEELAQQVVRVQRLDSPQREVRKVGV